MDVFFFFFFFFLGGGGGGGGEGVRARKGMLAPSKIIEGARLPAPSSYAYYLDTHLFHKGLEAAVAK